ncbi:unnamed protein product [Cylicocyclus nassatus]|uniref:Uncharacterized protein n=1 Tax=Cylicocyclus nassatus TaxID=53992 RepID=A0AA36GTR2_CYLNA|nr:unnamed protein product [Cylicocyclus nassatus]
MVQFSQLISFSNKNLEKNIEDKTPTAHMEEEKLYFDDKYIDFSIKVEIEDAECFSGSTSSQFTFYIGTLDHYSRFVSAYRIEFFEFAWNAENNTRSFIGSGKSHKDYSCFYKAMHDCVPRADVIFIRFDSIPDAPWAIEKITVRLDFNTGHYGVYRNMWRFDHPVLMPCRSWLKDNHMYQIGPRTGLFIEHEYDYFPKEGEWIRDWV